MTVGLWDTKLVMKWARLESPQAIWKAIHDDGFPLPRWSAPDGNLHKWHPGDVRMWMLGQRRREEAFQNAWGGQPVPTMKEEETKTHVMNSMFSNYIPPAPRPKSKYQKDYEESERRRLKDKEGGAAEVRQAIDGLEYGAWTDDWIIDDPFTDLEIGHFIERARKMEDE